MKEEFQHDWAHIFCLIDSLTYYDYDKMAEELTIEVLTNYRSDNFDGEKLYNKVIKRINEIGDK